MTPSFPLEQEGFASGLSPTNSTPLKLLGIPPESKLNLLTQSRRFITRYNRQVRQRGLVYKSVLFFPAHAPCSHRKRRALRLRVNQRALRAYFERVFTLGDARSFSGLTSKIPPLGSMLNFDGDVKKTTARHHCENR